MKHLILILCAFMLAVGGWAQQQDAAFNGYLLDLAGNPIKKARIWTCDARRYATTDKKGRFGLINVKTGDTLNIKVQKRYYQVPVEGMRSMRIHLGDYRVLSVEEDQHLVDIGYGFVKHREHTGFSSGITGEELRRSGSVNLLMALQGRIPGLLVSPNGLGHAEARIGGVNSIMLDQTPLFVVDGMVVSTLDNISVYDVDYVEVMKDASIYGSRGSNGAILVHTINSGK